jgi:hypothetical protein
VNRRVFLAQLADLFGQLVYWKLWNAVQSGEGTIE